MAAKEKRPVQDIPEEENVITPQEFEELEKKEKKPKKGLFSKKKEKKASRPEAAEIMPSRKEKASDIDKLFLENEKIQAKLETIEELRQTTEDKISRISEEIGELRSAILEKDRTFNKMEGGFEKIKEIFDEMQPVKLKASLDKKDDAIEKVNAKVEAAEFKISETKKSLESMKDFMEKIKDLKNLVSISDSVSKKVAKVEEERKETAKIAAKIESMFSELTEKTAEFHQYRDKIDFSSESMHDLMKSMDMLEVRVENAVSKDDFKKLDDRFEQLERDMTDRIGAIKDIVDDMAATLKKGGMKELLAKEGKTRIDEINKRLGQIDSFEKAVKSLQDELASVKSNKEKEISALSSKMESLKKQSASSYSYTPAAGPAPALKGRQSPAQVRSPAVAPDAEEDEEASMDLITPVTASSMSQNYKEDSLESMLEQCHVHIDKGDIEQARSLYSQILTIYEQSKDSGECPSPEEVYGKIKRLYYRLQIYH